MRAALNRLFLVQGPAPTAQVGLVSFWQRHGVFCLLLLWALALKVFNFIGLAEGDDLYYTQLADRAAHGDLRAFFIFDVRWLVFLPTAALYALFGVNDLTSLLMPILASMGSVYFAYRIVVQLFDQRTALFAVLIYSATPVILIYANVLQVAPFLECFTLATVFFLLRGLATGRLSYFLFCGLAIGLVAMTRITGLFISLIVAVTLLSARGWTVRNFLLLGAMALVSLLPLMVQDWIFGQVHGDYLHRLVMSRSVVAFQANLNGVDPKDLFFYLRTLFLREDFANWQYFGLLGFLGVPAALSMFGVGLRQYRFALLFCPLWFFGYFALMSFTPTSLDPYTTLIRNIRYAIVFVLPLSVCLAWAVLKLTDWKGAPWSGWTVLALIVATHLYLTVENSQRYHDRRAEQKAAIEQVLPLVGDQRVYLADRNIDRRLAYYSGYQFKNYQKINALQEIRQPGYFLMLKPGYNRQRYRLDPRLLAAIRQQPEAYGMRYLGDFGYFWVFKVER
ncbi:glycosyltransferase family 39 protein [Neptuniibacter sp. CAU 1671]|uniref:ArnT family glycosyltransferase n=1 Tax=Neptuniibacter sp. CAU 1671 TaxID=3032593 RepID=UPI0023DACBE2|nr:glycosyltransferase family 39 protein [Neptuniibacter sp. CAU 1671]MDF2182982.1 glycosyltransferase family 39 protein [Neptuniibacter sp. CAU 1671]